MSVRDLFFFFYPAFFHSLICFKIMADLFAFEVSFIRVLGAAFIYDSILTISGNFTGINPDLNTIIETLFICVITRYFLLMPWRYTTTAVAVLSTIIFSIDALYGVLWGWLDMAPGTPADYGIWPLFVGGTGVLICMGGVWITLRHFRVTLRPYVDAFIYSVGNRNGLAIIVAVLAQIAALGISIEGILYNHLGGPFRSIILAGATTFSLFSATTAGRSYILEHYAFHTPQRRERGISHDLRNHLSNIQVLLRRGLLNDASNYMKNLIGELGDITDLEEVGDSYLAAIISATLARFNDVKTSIDVRAPWRAQVNPVDLTATIGNALTNAAEAAGSGGWIEIIIDEDYEMSFFIVRNSGEMPLVARIAAFSTCFSSKGQGRGQGLAQIKRVIRDREGYTRVSTITGGTEVTIAFPLPTPNLVHEG
ncbi:GHKL domain-containing protein [Heliobacterium gestii]|uniref:GHKL domain-containing protein n=1 Tax=Heliomicrobium gestii TaxID=2699 RepID=A0A845LD91_HELGE|nr:ATP-binding protein [Heliomicrobium gestii]MBM7867765.1 hypothetical protein [Heliomicrobium gestii]MZP44158.1 GHKL domain-containing protein [Heliomicrobium gestii]